MATLLKSKKNLISFLVVLLLICSSFFIVKLKAQTSSSSQTLEVSPPSQEIQGDPGQILAVKAKIRNISNSSVPILVSLQDFTASGDEGQVALTTGGKWSLTTWTKISPDHFVLAPGAQQEVTATITIPKIGEAGGRYGSFLFAVGTKEKGGNASLSQQIASLFLVRISGKMDENLTLTSMNVPKFSEFGPIPISLKFVNNGNIYVKTFGLVSITNMFGKKEADLVVKGTNVFPGAERVVNTQLPKKFLFGQYTITAIMYYGQTNQTLTSTNTFIVFPVRIIIPAIGILLILFLIRKRLSKALKALTGK